MTEVQPGDPQYSNPGPSTGLETRAGGWRSQNRKKRGRKNAKKAPKELPPMDPSKLASAEMRGSFNRGKRGSRRSRKSRNSKRGGPMEEMTTRGSQFIPAHGGSHEMARQSHLNYQAAEFVPGAPQPTRKSSVLNANTRSFVPSNTHVAIPLQMATQSQDIVYGIPTGMPDMNTLQLSPGGTSFLTRGPPRFSHPQPEQFQQPMVYAPMDTVPAQVRTEFRQPTPLGLILKPPMGVNINKAEFDGIPSPPPYHPKDGWTVYWNPPTSIKHSTHNEEYLKSLKELQSFDGIADFWKKVKTIQAPSKITHGHHNLMVFRKGLVPAWETFPHGGAWIVTYDRNDIELVSKIDSVWQTVMFGLVSEGLGTPEVVGASLHIREMGYKVCIWNRDNRVEDARFQIADKLRMLLSIHPKQEVKYKFFSRALQDGSTTCQAIPYQFVKVSM